MNSQTLRKLGRLLTILVIASQLAPSAAVIAAPHSAPTTSAARAHQDRNAPASAASEILRRQPGEPRDVYFARAAQADPELFQAAFLQALQDYLNRPESDLASEDDFYRTVERYLNPAPAGLQDHIARFLESRPRGDAATQESAPGSVQPPSAPGPEGSTVARMPPPPASGRDAPQSPQPADPAAASHLAAPVVPAALPAAEIMMPAADDVIFWNKLGSAAELLNSEIGPGIQLASYLYSDWQEARFEPAQFNDGLFINHDIEEGWRNDGGNFFAIDTTQIPLSPERGTIEFWFKFRYGAGTPNHAYFFLSGNRLAAHQPNCDLNTDLVLAAGWNGWDYGSYGKRFFFEIGKPTEEWGFAIHTPDYSAAPGGSLAFNDGDLVHFAFVWDVNGIEGISDTMQIYVNGALQASGAGVWPTTSPLDRYLWVGSAPNCDPWDHVYNAVRGVTDNLIIHNVARTDFSERFSEMPGTVTPSPTPTPAPPPVARVENVSLNGDGANVTVDRGGNVAIGLDYEISNPDWCPTCIRQIVVGLAGKGLYCAYDGIPPVNPTLTGHSLETIIAPLQPGIYWLGWITTYEYTCADALAKYGAGESPPAIGIISVLEPSPTPSQTPTWTPSSTPSRTFTPSRTPTVTPAPPNTATPTATSTRTPTATRTPTRMPTVTPPSPNTATPTRTPTPTPTATRTPTRTPTATVTARPRLLLSEVLYDASQSGTDHSWEWVELFNAGDTAVNLTGWRLGDNSSQDSIPAFSLTPGGVLVIAATLAGFRENHPDFVGHLVALESPIGNGLSNTGDVVRLLAPDGGLVDAMSYGSNTAGFDPPCPTVAPGQSLARAPSDRDTDARDDWIRQTTPNPGIPGAQPIMTPTPTRTSTPSRTPAVTRTPTATPTTPPGGRTTRTIGVVKITADTFTDLGGGQTRASGSVLLGDFLPLAGPGDYVVYNNTTLTGSVTFTLQVSGERLDLFTGSFSVPVLTGVGTLGAGAVYNFDRLAGFPLDTTLSVTQFNIPSGTISGTADIRAGIKGINVNARATFSISASLTQGIQYSGGLAAFTLAVAGMTLSVPQGALLSDSGIDAPVVTLTLPASLGGASGAVNALHISPDGISLAGATAAFNLPDLKIGDGTKLRITGITAHLTITGNRYAFTAGGALALNLPGNNQNIPVSFAIDSTGAMSGTVSQLSLALAGATLKLANLTISNTGLAVASAALTLPASLGSGSATITDVSITQSGLAFAAASITFPDIKFGDGSRVRIVQLEGTLAAATGGYTFSLNGQLQVRLPGNSQDISIQGSISTAGQFSASVSQLTLNLAGVQLSLTGLTVSNDGLSVASGALMLPAKLGGASGSVTNVTITKDGLQIGGGLLEIPFPDFKLGGSAGFSVTGVKATIEIVNNGQAYKLTLAGAVAISIPGSNASAAGSITVDSQGNISGTVNAFSLTVAGLSLEASGIIISADGSLAMNSASLALPPAFGGGGASLYNVRISAAAGLSIGGGSFSLPQIKAGGFTLGSLSGSLIKVGNAYEISASGVFGIPGLGSAAGCAGIAVSVKLYTTSAGQTVLEVAPREVSTVKAQQVSSAAAAQWPSSPAGVGLREVSISLECQIPIGQTGFFMTKAWGTVTLGSGSTRVEMGVEIAAGKKIGGVAVLSANASAYVVSSPFEIGLSGSIKVFVFTVGGASATIKSNSFKATLWIEMIVARGNLAVNAWSDARGFHLTGSAVLEVGIPKGKILSVCTPFIDCEIRWERPCGCKWYKPWCCVYVPVKVRCWTTELCVNIPPSNWILGRIGADAGEFTNGNWGFKGYVEVLGSKYGFFIDTSGNLSFSNVDQYRLVTPAQVAQARVAWTAWQVGGLRPAGLDAPDAIAFTPSGDIVVDIPISVTTDATFAVNRNGEAPLLTLTAPDGTVIDPAHLPPNVTYREDVSYSLAIPAQITTTLGAAADGIKPPSLGISWQVTPTLLTPAGAWPSLRLEGPLNTTVPIPQRIASKLANPPENAQVAAQPALSALCRGAASCDTEALCSSEAAYPAGRLRFIQAAPDVAAADIWLNGDNLFQGLDFGGVTGYEELLAGPHTVQFKAAGSATELISVTVDLQANTDYALALMDRAGSLQPLLMVDENWPLPETGALVRFVNLAPGAPAADLAQPSGRRFAEGVPPKGVSPYLPLDAGAYDLEARVADSDTVLALASGVAFAKGGVYTVFLMGLQDGAPGLRLVTRADDAPPARVRFVNAIPGGPALDLLLRQPASGVAAYALMFTQTAPFTPTAYVSVDPGSSFFRITPAGATAPVLANPSLNLVGGKDYTVVMSGPPAGPAAMIVPDDNRIPEAGQVRVRFAHLSPDGPAVDVAVPGGVVLFANVPFNTVSGYVTLTGGAYDLELRAAGTSNVLARLSAAELREGQVYTLYALGWVSGAPGLELSLRTDVATQKLVQSVYEVKDIQPGLWRAKLSGDIGPTDDYVFTALGVTPAPVLEDISVTPGVGNTAQAGWRLTSPQADTRISIYANSGPITTTQVITAQDGTVTTAEIPLYTGPALAYGLTGVDTSWVDGSPQAHPVDLGRLPSGIYRIWLEAEDGRSAPARAYAPESVTVTHRWQDTWAAGLSARAGYRQLEMTWNLSQHPDVDRYRLAIGAAAGAADQVIDIGDVTSYVFDSLTPGQRYYVWLEAVDLETGQTSLSETLAAIPAGASFTLGADALAAEIIGGEAVTLTVNLTTTLAAYPDAVGLYGGLLPNGLNLAFQPGVITPTVAGTPASLVLSAAATLPGGAYQVPIWAAGGGITRVLTFNVTILRPGFTVSVTPAAAVIGQDESLAITVSAAGTHGYADPIDLSLENAPPGLLYTFDQHTVMPGDVVTLVITDTELLADGQYTLELAAAAGLQTNTMPIPLTVDKPGFALLTEMPRLDIQAGDVAILPVILDGLRWQAPVTLSLGAGSSVPAAEVGLALAPGDAPAARLTVTPWLKFYLIVRTNAGTPAGLYQLQVDAASGGRQQTIRMLVGVEGDDGALRCHLPMIYR